MNLLCFTAAIYINEEQIRGNMYDIRSTELESARVAVLYSVVSSVNGAEGSEVSNTATSYVQSAFRF